MITILLTTDRPIASDSPDHLMPHGTARDNSRNWLFNRKLFALFRYKPLRILDIGCAGGGFVRACVDAGHLAVGIEGSDFSKTHRRAEWARIPDNLFTCDATADFTFRWADPETGKAGALAFDIITGWEFIEHIATDKLHDVCKNVKSCLAPGGLWIMSISPNEEVVSGVRLHQTVRPAPWWLELFASAGFCNHRGLVSYFDPDWIRGPLQGAPGSFHVVLTRMGETPPTLPPTVVLGRLMWLSTILNTARSIRILLLRMARRAARGVVPEAVRRSFRSTGTRF